MQKEFNKVKPYCYFISRKKDSAFYFGVRYRNIRFNRTPNEDFAKFYFTSGRLKKEFESNISNFNYRLVYTFDTVKEAQEYEVKINKKLVKRKNAANMAAYPFINLDDPKIYAKFLKSRKSEEYREKLRQKKLGKKLSKETIMKRQKNRVYKPWSEEHKKYMSKILKGRQRSKESIEKGRKKLIGKKLSKEHVQSLKNAWARAKKLGQRKLSPEARKEISKRMLKNHPLRGLYGKNNPNFGKKRRPGTGEKISKAKMGHSVSLETRRKISETLKGKKTRSL